MKIFITLGNPGEKYLKTRHNTGFMFADVLAERLGISDFSYENKFKAIIGKGLYNYTETVWIVKPQTFMNLSGETVNLLVKFYKLNPSDFFIVYDDIALELGKIRLRSKGSDGGHNGIKSIIAHLGTQNFDRLKIGIGLQPSYMKSEDYVLQNFSNDEMKILKETLNTAIDAVLYCIDHSLTEAQNKYN